MEITGNLEETLNGHQISCFECKEQFITELDLKYHIKQKHPNCNDDLFPCIFCVAILSGPLFNAHLRSHTGLIGYKCGVCEQSLRSQGDLYRHQLLHTDVDTDTYTNHNVFRCYLCNVKFENNDQLTQHLTSHEELNVSTDTESDLGDKLISCSHCGDKFMSEADYKFHQKDKHSDHVINSQHPFCSICIKSFPNKSTYKTHMTSHTKERPFKCKFCDSAFKVKTHLQRHEQNHAADKPYACLLCDRGYKNQSDLDKHNERFEKKHAKLNPDLSQTPLRTFICEICGDSFDQNFKLRYHLQNHVGDLPHKCDVCDKGFVTPSRLRKHQLVHAAGLKEQKLFRCNICDLTFEQNLQLAEHLNTHDEQFVFTYNENGERNLLTCSKCGEQFQSESEYQYHLKERHPNFNNKIYRCDQCNKLFTELLNLKKHSSMHSEDRPFQCTQCRKSFKLKDQLRRHSEVHADTKSYFCIDCDYSCNTINDLNKHRAKKHNSETGDIHDEITVGKSALSKKQRHLKYESKPYLCHYCGMRLSSLFMLTSHIYIHTDERPFECDICHKTFRLKKNLRLHSRVHSDNKEAFNKFVCNVCGRGCVSNAKLVIHMRTHTGDKPYACKICGACFSHTSTRATHQKVHIVTTNVDASA